MASAAGAKRGGDVVQIYLVYTALLSNLDERRKNGPVDASHLRNGALLRVSTLLLVLSIVGAIVSAPLAIWLT
jgi:hypothetical protein